MDMSTASYEDGLSYETNYTDGRMFYNDTHNNTESKPYPQGLETYIVPAIFAVMFVVGLIGNSTVIYIFIKDKSMRSAPNALITSLAVGDLVVFLGALPFTCTIFTFESWPYGLFICKLSEFMRDVSVGVTVFTLTVLSFDRYMAIAWPFHRHKHNSTKRFTAVTVILVWGASFGIAFPGAYYSYLLEVRPNMVICYPFPIHNYDWYPYVMVLTKFVVLYVVPLLIVAFFYTLMAIKLLSSRSTLGANDSQMQLMKSRAKVAKLVLAFVVVFAVCLLPNHLFMLWFYFTPKAYDKFNNFWLVLRIMGFVLTYANSCLNPLALYFISGVYRNHYRRYLFRTCCPPEEDLNCKTRMSSTRTSRTYSKITATSKV